MVNIFKMCKQYLVKNKKSIIIYGLLCFLSSLFAMISPYVSGHFIDYLIMANDIKMLYPYCIIFFLIAIIAQILGYFVNRYYIKIQTKMGYELNYDIIQHVQHLPVSFLKKQNMAYLNQRINNDSNQVVTFCINIVQGVLINSLKIVLSILILIQFNQNITLLLIAIILAYFVLYKMLKKVLFDAQFILTEAQAKYFAKLYEQFRDIIFVKLQSIYKNFLERLKKEFENIFKISLYYQKISYLFSTLDSLVMSLAQVGIFILGGTLVIEGKLSVGQLTIMLSYFGIMMESARYFFSLTKTVQDNKVSYTRLKNIWDMKPDENEGNQLNNITQIEMKNITFFHGKKCIFQNFSMQFQKGKIYSIIGKNGIGKSTLIELLIGFYKREYSGEIFYNNVSIKEIDTCEVRNRCFGISEQEPVLLSDAIWYNVLLDGESELDSEKLNRISKKINLYTFITKLPEKWETVIDEKNSNLSGGEKQKISILRALYKDASVIILDEPTSALDAQSICCLQNYLIEIKRDKIILLISHNSEFISISDQIIDLDKIEAHL